MFRTLALFLLTLTVACSSPVIERDFIERSSAITPADDAGNPPAADDAGIVEDAAMLGPNQTATNGWQSFGTLETGNSNKKASLQAAFPESNSYTVQFNINNPPVDASGNPVPFVARADITWKVQGGYVKRTIDVGNGTSISGTAQAVDVVVYDFTPVLDANNPTWVAGGNEYKVGIQVARGLRPSTQQPVTLAEQFQDSNSGNLRSYSYVLAGGATQHDVDVPQDVGVIGVEVAVHNQDNTPLVDGDVYLIQANAATISKIYQCPITPQFIDISPATTILTLANNHAKGVYVSVTWAIDG